MPARRRIRFQPRHRRQRGAAFMVMLVILIIGAVTIFVSSLSSSAIQVERDRNTAAALAQAKEALIGYAVKDSNRPGSLPCPDVDDDGKLTMGVDFNGSCTSPIGRLPWKTLGLPELRDGAGEHLWYAVTKSFWATGSSAINSDTQGNLNITGITPASSIIAIVFAPGNVLFGQSRSASTAPCTTTSTTIAQNLCATNYLEGSNANLSTAATPNTSYQTAIPGSTFNDQMIYITHDQLFVSVEMRIAREAKNCLDYYAASSANKYPWAVPVNDTTNYIAIQDTLFGRISQPNNSTTPVIDGLLNALASLQIALNNYSAKNTLATRAALSNAGSVLENTAESLSNIQPTVPPVSDSIITPAINAGNYAQNLAGGSSSIATVQSQINSANAAIANATPALIDTTMATTWPSSCTLFSASYWPSWQSEVFYQVANGFQPGSSASFGTPLSINGSGTYRAVVIVARKAIGLQDRTTPSDLNNYLEGINPHSTTSATFETYKPTDTANYQNINDLVLCMDGKVSCQ